VRPVRRALGTAASAVAAAAAAAAEVCCSRGSCWYGWVGGYHLLEGQLLLRFRLHCFARLLEQLRRSDLQDCRCIVTDTELWVHCHMYCRLTCLHVSTIVDSFKAVLLYSGCTAANRYSVPLYSRCTAGIEACSPIRQLLHSCSCYSAVAGPT
jgi:hypothetical protein